MCRHCRESGDSGDDGGREITVLGADGVCGTKGCNEKSAQHQGGLGMCLVAGCDCEQFALPTEIRERITAGAAEELLLFEHPPRMPAPMAEVVRAAVTSMEHAIHEDGWDNPRMPVMCAFRMGKIESVEGLEGPGVGLRVADMNVPRELWQHCVTDHGTALHAVTEMAEYVQFYPEVMEGDDRRGVVAIAIALECYRRSRDDGPVEGEVRVVIAADIDGRFYACVRDRAEDKPVTVLQRPGQYDAVVGGRYVDILATAPVVLTDFMQRIIEPAWGRRPTREAGYVPSREDVKRVRDMFTRGDADAGPGAGAGTSGEPSGNVPRESDAGTPPEHRDPPAPPGGSQTAG